MYIAVRRYEGDPGSLDEVIRRVKDEFVPMISKAPGFIDYYCFETREPGRGIVTSISIFQDKSGADESTRMAADWVHQRLSSLLPNPPEVTSGEVPVHAKAGVR